MRRKGFRFEFRMEVAAKKPWMLIARRSKLGSKVRQMANSDLRFISLAINFCTSFNFSVLRRETLDSLNRK